MKVRRFDACNAADYETTETDIRKVADIYGHAEDVVKLYDDNGELVGAAVWPRGSKCYMYSYGKNLDRGIYAY